MTVVSTTGLPADTDLEYSGLLALARPVLPSLRGIPGHQAVALREALGFAIRLADTDGNPATEPDPAWTSLVASPYPDYPSGHACITGAFSHTVSKR
jgi:hypothetical protein